MKGKIACAFCDRAEIDPNKPTDTQGGQPICPECRADWWKCFKPQGGVTQKVFDFMLT